MIKGKQLTQSPAPRRVARCVSAVLLLFMIAFGLNVHLFFLQVWGWSGMMLDYRSETGSWMHAASMTFGGEAPCNVCKNVETALRGPENATAQPYSHSETRTLNWLLVLPVKLLPVLPCVPPVFEIAGSPLEKPLGLVIPPASPPPRFTVS